MQLKATKFAALLSRLRLAPFALAAALAALVGSPAFAAFHWSGSSYDNAHWTPSSGNILKGLAPTVGGIFSTIDNLSTTGGAACLTDGQISSATDETVLPTVACIKGNTTQNTALIWEFDGLATVESLRINTLYPFSQWGHSNINVVRVDVQYPSSTSWHTVWSGPYTYFGEEMRGAKQAILSSDSGEKLFEGATKMQLVVCPTLYTSGTQVYNSSLAEIEAIGTVTTRRQWVRFTITKKLMRTKSDDTLEYPQVELGRFALFDAAGNCLNEGLTRNTTLYPVPNPLNTSSLTPVFKRPADQLRPGTYLYAGCYNMQGNDVSTNLFTASGKWGTANVQPLETGNTGYYQEFTMRLADNAAKVAKYNLRSGDSVAGLKGRAPTCWVVETSDNGIDWAVCDEQQDEATSGYTTDNNTWYGDGGNGATPNTFYALQAQEFALPAGYKRLEWIKSTRQQRILTDYHPNPKTWMQVDCKFSNVFQYSGHDLSDAKEQYFFGTAREDNRIRYNMCFGGNSDQKNLIWYFPDSTTSGGFHVKDGSVGGENALRSLLTISNGVENTVVEWTGGKGEGTTSVGRKTQDCPDPLVLFGLGDKNFGSYEMTVWSWKIYESDSGSGNDHSSHLVHNFIPALNPDNVPGLFDTITGEFRSSATETQFAYHEADQWFRFTMTRKWGGAAGNMNFLELDELALYTVENENVAQGLMSSSATGAAIPAGSFHANFTAVSGDISMIFDGIHDGSHKINASIADENAFNCCYTIHLRAGAGEVVKYNLMTGDSAGGAHQVRAPITWTLERSYDGVNWEVVDNQTDEKTSGRCPQSKLTWYNKGGQYDATTGANALPQTFYWLIEVPRPEMLIAEYDYTGSAISPLVKLPEGVAVTAGGVVSATDVGTYTITYTLPEGEKWIGGSSAPCTLEWKIVSQRKPFLQTLAESPNRVDKAPWVDGADIVHKLTDGAHTDYVLIFTNVGERTMTVARDIPGAQVLLVGGGGGAGVTLSWSANGQCRPAGGGGGGGVAYMENIHFSSGYYQVSVGAGGAGGINYNYRRAGRVGGSSSIRCGTDFSYSIIGGGGGGSCGDSSAFYEAATSGATGGGAGGYCTWNQSSWDSATYGVPGSGSLYGFGGGECVGSSDKKALAGGGGGGAGGPGRPNTDKAYGQSVSEVSGGEGVKNAILGEFVGFGGGGAGGAFNSRRLYGVDGGGSSIQGSTRQSGEDGLGGGGAAPWTPANVGNTDPPFAGMRGGNGIVIVRYTCDEEEPVTPQPEVDIQSTGAEISMVGDDVVLVFKNWQDAANNTFTLDEEVRARMLVVGGGGSGGRAGNHREGGGGAGGMIELAEQRILPGTYRVVVGKGGAAVLTSPNDGIRGNTGGNSLVTRIDDDSEIVKALGGGGGGAGTGGTESFDDEVVNGRGRDGGSGGGGAYGNSTIGYGTPGKPLNPAFGYSGGNGTENNCGGGGGGADGAGGAAGNQIGGAGGAAKLSDITGEERAYAGGGGGGGNTSGGAGGAAGGMTVGGSGGYGSYLGFPAVDGTGSGSGGGLPGASGVVIVRISNAKAKLPVAFDSNGGTGGQTEPKTATFGEAMPTPVATPALDGFKFMGYGASSWEARLMTGNESDVCNEGTTVFAAMGNNGGGTINGVAFTGGLTGPLAGHLQFGETGAWSASQTDYTTQGLSASAYGNLLQGGIWRTKASDSITLQGLTVGHAYLFQFFVHEGRDESKFPRLRTRQVSVDQVTWYQLGLHPNQEAGPTRDIYGVTFIYRFVATAETETFPVYFWKGSSSDVTEQFNAIQLRDITMVAENPAKYYNTDGTSAKDCDLSDATTLYGIWRVQPLTASLSAVVSETDPTAATVTMNVSALGEEGELLAVLRWGTTENCTEGAKVMSRTPVAAGSSLVENLTGLIPGTNYYAKVEFVRADRSVAPMDVVPMATFETPAVDASAYADVLSVTGAARSERLDDGSLLYVFTDTNAAASFTIAKGGLARLLVVGGGGAGGFYGYHAATGGGGGGAVIDQVLELESGTYNVTVGAGGVFDDASINSKWSTDNETHYNGSPSSVRLDGASDDVLSALGGGGGGNMDGNGGEGANGGGGSTYHKVPNDPFLSGGGGLGTVGFDGGAAWGPSGTSSTYQKMHMGGGGAGAGGFGGSVTDENGRGTGGIGLYSSILDLPETDDVAWFGGGGAGGAGVGSEDDLRTEMVAGGRGGGASSREWSGKNALANPGTPGTGGGGSGVVQHYGNSVSKGTANGGSGIVVLRIYGNMCVPVALNKNGGTTEPNPATVMATPGAAMPQLENGQKLTGTRTGYTFQGYSAEGWKVSYMSGDPAQDVCKEGTTKFAKLVGSANEEVNGVTFLSDLATAANRNAVMELAGEWKSPYSNTYFNEDKDGGYGQILGNAIYQDNLSVANVKLKGLTAGRTYLFQLFVHDGRTGYCNRTVSADGATWLKVGNFSGGEEKFGVSMIRRFVANGSEETLQVYFGGSSISAQINAAQLRDITESDGSLKYYNADGTSAKAYPASGGPTELFAIWQPITYTIKFGGDAETGGTMADLVCTYDVPTNLPPNQLKREYTITLNPNGGSVSPTSLTCSWPFSRWKLDNTHFYDDQAQVTNLTTVNNGTVWLAPQWNEGRVSLPVPSRDGYVFEGWYDGDTKIGNLDSYMCMGPKTLVAHWSLATYTVNYTLNGGTAGTSQPASAMPGTAFEVSAPTKSGCHFIGWKVSGFASGAKWGTSSDAVTTDVTADGLCFNDTSSVWFKSLAAAGGTVTLTAQWRTDVTKPTAATGLVYNGNEQIGVAAATGYSVANGKATNAGDYTATVTLTDGYCWSDGTTDNASVSWSIAKAAIVASAADVEKEYDGVAAHIAVTVTTPASGATVTYCTTSNGEYTATNPQYSEFGAHRVYWKVTAANYEEANGSAVVRIGKKAAGEFVRLTVTKRKGGDSYDGYGQGDFEFCELNLYEDIAGTPEKLISSGLELASGLADLKNRAGTCYAFPTNFYYEQNVSKLFDGQADGQSKHCCPRNSTSTNFTDAHIEIYMHLSDASKVIRSYNLQSGNDIKVNPARSPTAWRLEVSSDCERWTVIDEKTIDTANEPALNTNKTWYNGGTPYPINLDYVPMEVLETNPYAEGTEAYKKVKNYIQIVGFQLDRDNVVTTRVQYNGTNSGSWDSLFCQRDLKGNGSFAVHRQSSGDKSPRIRFDYGNNQTSVMAKVTGDYKFVASASGGLVTNGYPAVATAPCTWTSLPDNSLLLFASDSASACDGIPVQNWTYLKCYYFQVAESATDSTLRLDLVPASNTVSHAQGLYDRVSGNFYPLQDGGVAGKPAFTAAQPKVTFSKELAAVKGEDGWDQFPLVTEVAYSGTYLTSITNYWQQEWVPAAVTGAGEYRLVMRGQGPYKGAVTNVYTVCARVALDANGGTAGATNSVLVLPGKALPNITGAGALPTREGYDFVGYFDGASGGTKYYNADGTGVEGVTYPADNGPETLYAHWQAIKFHVIRPDGPEIVVDWGWLKGAFAGSATKAQYQQCLFTTNDSGVVAWQTYVLGFEPGEVSTAAIVEETVQNANPDTVTIRLRGMPAEPRTNATTRLAYSLYSARTTEAFAKGEDALVIDGDAKPFEKSEKSTFEAPLSDLTDLEPVNYYRIRVHFIFDGGK